MIYKEIVQLLTQGRKAVLATVIQQSGSAPRKSGAQMVIGEDGSSWGSVGGGRLEADVLAAARQVAAAGVPAVLAFHLTGTDVAETEMLCGGDAEVFVEPLAPALLDLYTNLLAIQRRGGEAVVATVINADPLHDTTGRKGLVIAEGRPIGPLPLTGDPLAAAQEVMREKKVRLIPYEGGRLYLEPVFPEPVLYIFGAGHVSRFIAPVAHLVGFKVIVIDDRADFASREHFPEADEIWVEEFEGIGKKIDPAEQTYVVIVTRGHMHDYAVLRQALETDARYIGMIGSRRKRDIIYRQLRQEGRSPGELERVHAPIGLAIGAETPEEIAVSIVAELIAVRAGLKAPREKAWKV